MHIVHSAVKFFCLLVVITLLAACAAGPAADTPPAPGSPAPSLALPSLNGETVQLSDFQGNVVLVNFWASWCAPCLAEMPRLQQWHDQHEDDGLVVLGVNTLYQDSREAVEMFLQDHDISYPMLLDTEGDASRQWLARQLPRSYLIDRQGVVRWTRLGEVTAHDWETEIAPLLKEPH
jgi:cytochrome c biogenesis protein CcmG/thiol:disulfide interchange protein DsbE